MPAAFPWDLWKSGLCIYLEGPLAIDRRAVQIPLLSRKRQRSDRFTIPLWKTGAARHIKKCAAGLAVFHKNGSQANAGQSYHSQPLIYADYGSHYNKHNPTSGLIQN